MVAELLLEIGTEEIPSGYLENALSELRRLGTACLEENRIETAGGIHTYGTPRRLVLIVKAVAERQQDEIREVTGPPKKAAFDSEGNPTKAATGFARKQGVAVDELELLNTPKGEYLYVKRTVSGRPTSEVLADALPGLIADIPWPKSMRWGREKFLFVRPIQWLLALFNGEVVPFEIAGTRSSNRTRGHRFMAPAEWEVTTLQDYLQKIEAGFVKIDQREREKEVDRIVQEAGIRAEDPELVSIVANLVEWPSAVCGAFEQEFLRLPEAVLITPMREHQRYFAVRDRAGRLMPNFVAVNNTVARDEDVVRKGHERVLRARLADASFFFNEDRKKPLRERLDDLKGVIYQAELGTSYAKVQRFAELARYLAVQVAPEKMEQVREAALLSKCDLVTEMVMEFPSLQGIIGREYARLDGHPESICESIREHYLPARAGDALPTSQIGAIVGVADRIDTITGFFSVGLEPTGAADPFALRRHALAVIRIVEEMGWEVKLRDLVSRSLGHLHDEIAFDSDSVCSKVVGFFRERYKNMMARAGHESDLIEAVISAEFDRLSTLRARIEQLEAFKAGSAAFEPLVLTSKRISNILKKQQEVLSVDPALFEDDSEKRLWQTFEELRGDVQHSVEEGQYLEALERMSRLIMPVDALFEGVEIMTKKAPRLRNNRVGLLQALSGFFLQLADFSKFSI
jgi:glycyl-tRNA synthetase beta chain